MNKKMNKYEKYYNSELKLYLFELKKDYQRGSKLLPVGTKIPTTTDGIDWFLKNGFGEKKTKKAQKGQK